MNGKKFTIVESVGKRIEHVHDFEDLEKHHPSSGKEKDRSYKTIDGQLEEVRYVSGEALIKKDFILLIDGASRVDIPSPVEGYTQVSHAYGQIAIYDQPQGGKLLGKILHVDPSTFRVQDGDKVEYGQALGRQSGMGEKRIHEYGIHTHMELRKTDFERYITDINEGNITSKGFQGKTPVLGEQQQNNLEKDHNKTADPANTFNTHTVDPADIAHQQKKDPAQIFAQSSTHIFGQDTNIIAKLGDNGQLVERMQSLLVANGAKLQVDGVFGPETERALKGFQLMQSMDATGQLSLPSLAKLQEVELKNEQAHTPQSHVVQQGLQAWQDFKVEIIQIVEKLLDDKPVSLPSSVKASDPAYHACDLVMSRNEQYAKAPQEIKEQAMQMFVDVQNQRVEKSAEPVSASSELTR